MQNLNLIDSPASYLTEKYHHVSTESLTKAFIESGFNVAQGYKSSLRQPIDPRLNMATFEKLTLEERELAVNKFMNRMQRYEARKGHEKHFLRFKSGDLALRSKENDLFLRITNSYDGTSSLKVSLDILRLVCMNGLVAPRSMFQLSVSHRSKNIVQDAIEASYKIIDRKEKLDEQIDLMKQTVLSSDQKIILLDEMLKLRSSEENINALDNLHLLNPKRIEERDDNLWQNFNTVQENMIRGSRVRLLDAEGRFINKTIREVKSQTNADTFNEKSWNLAMSLVG